MAAELAHTVKLRAADLDAMKVDQYDHKPGQKIIRESKKSATMASAMQMHD